MSQGAQVGSIAAIADFQAALANYVAESKQALTMLDLEIRRAADYVKIDRAKYWQQEIRKAGEAVARAKDELHRCLTFKSSDNFTPSCIDEKKALQKAQERVRLAEQKAEAVRHWSRAMQHELNEFAGRMVQFNAVLEGDIPRAMAVLHTILDTLDRYVSTTAPLPMDEAELERPGSIASAQSEVAEEQVAEVKKEGGASDRPPTESPSPLTGEGRGAGDSGALDPQSHPPAYTGGSSSNPHPPTPNP
jgi:hypothetical protein